MLKFPLYPPITSKKQNSNWKPENYIANGWLQNQSTTCISTTNTVKNHRNVSE